MGKKKARKKGRLEQFSSENFGKSGKFDIYSDSALVMHIVFFEKKLRAWNYKFYINPKNEITVIWPRATFKGLRVKRILEQLSRTGFFKGLEFPTIFEIP